MAVGGAVVTGGAHPGDALDIRQLEELIVGGEKAGAESALASAIADGDDGRDRGAGVDRGGQGISQNVATIDVQDGRAGGGSSGPLHIKVRLIKIRCYEARDGAS